MPTTVRFIHVTFLDARKKTKCLIKKHLGRRLRRSHLRRLSAFSSPEKLAPSADPVAPPNAELAPPGLSWAFLVDRLFLIGLAAPVGILVYGASVCYFAGTKTLIVWTRRAVKCVKKKWIICGKASGKDGKVLGQHNPPLGTSTVI